MGESKNENSLQHAKRLAEAGKLDEAYEMLVSLSYGQVPTHTITHLYAALRKSILEKLRQRFPNPNAFPQRLTSNADVKQYHLKAREAFILGQIDGTLAIDDIIAISPVDELATLQALARMIDLGLLGIGVSA
jgi:hypothetical protein